MSTHSSLFAKATGEISDQMFRQWQARQKEGNLTPYVSRDEADASRPNRTKAIFNDKIMFSEDVEATAAEISRQATEEARSRNWLKLRNAALDRLMMSIGEEGVILLEERCSPEEKDHITDSCMAQYEAMKFGGKLNSIGASGENVPNLFDLDKLGIPERLLSRLKESQSSFAATAVLSRLQQAAEIHLVAQIGQEAMKSLEKRDDFDEVIKGVMRQQAEWQLNGGPLDHEGKLKPINLAKLGLSDKELAEINGGNAGRVPVAVGPATAEQLARRVSATTVPLARG
ncbi:MAG: hypothetical protein SFW64_06445 [Alphaproteobacteria bacterium]|nr:hypothetical protein [Alphaproteobacteria bacterium]